MSYFFNTNFIDALTADSTLMDGATITAVFFPIAPALTVDDTTSSPYADIDDIDTLAATLGWGPYLTQTSSQTVTINSTAFAGSYYAVLDNLPPDPAFPLPESPEFPTTFIKAIAFVYSGPDVGMTDNIIFVSNTPLGAGELLTHNDAIIARPDTRFTYPGNRWLFSWSVSVDPLAPLEMSEGPITLRRGAPVTYDQAATVHVWLYPQRINFIANPSFETNTSFWRTNGTLTQNGDHPPFSGNFSGKVVGASPLIIESNMFPMSQPPKKDQGWTIQAKVKSDGEVKVGLISWEADFASTAADWGPIKRLYPPYYTYPSNELGKPCERWFPGDVFINLRTHRYVGEAHTGMLRFESYGSYLYIDQVCVEPGFLPHNYDDWLYFDGHSVQYGLPGDFSWYGEPDNSYSLCYYHRNAVIGRLFSWGLDNEDRGVDRSITDRETMEQGMVYQWVPAGTPVQEHLDVLYPYDPKTAIPPVIGDVLAYSSGPSDPLGVTNPWETPIIDVVGITDSIALSGDVSRTPDPDTLAITDDTVREITGIEMTPDTLGITDTVERGFGIEPADTLGIADVTARDSDTASGFDHADSVGITDDTDRDVETAPMYLLEEHWTGDDGDPWA